MGRCHAAARWPLNLLQEATLPGAQWYGAACRMVTCFEVQTIGVAAAAASGSPYHIADTLGVLAPILGELS